MTTSNTDEKLITKKDLLHSACNIGALGMEYSWNYPRQMHLAFCLMINPMLKKIYADDPEGVVPSTYSVNADTGSVLPS